MVKHLSFQLLISLAEGRASSVDQARSQRHLLNCARCRSELQWLERIQSPPGLRTRDYQVEGAAPVPEHRPSEAVRTQV
jgi:hypothetical protein